MIIFVGDKPSLRMAKGAKPLEGATCEKRLMEWINFLVDTKYDTYKVINQVDKDLAAHLLLAYIYEHPVVALGNIAYKKLQKYGYESFKLPHPSLRNRQHNNPEFIKQKLAECKEYIKGVN